MWLIQFIFLAELTVLDRARILLGILPEIRCLGLNKSRIEQVIVP